MAARHILPCPDRGKVCLVYPGQLRAAAGVIGTGGAVADEQNRQRKVGLPALPAADHKEDDKRDQHSKDRQYQGDMFLNPHQGNDGYDKRKQNNHRLL